MFRGPERKVITSRCQQIVRTNDINRPAKDVVTRINWVAEDYLNFLEDSEYVFTPLEEEGRSIWPSEEMEAAWGYLRAALLHYFRHQANSDEASYPARKKAHLVRCWLPDCNRGIFPVIVSLAILLLQSCCPYNLLACCLPGCLK